MIKFVKENLNISVAVSARIRVSMACLECPVLPLRSFLSLSAERFIDLCILQKG